MELGNALNWFEIPVEDFDRAKKFYETLFQYEMPESTMGSARMGFFVYDMENDGRGGAIVHSPDFYTPSDHGTLVYLNCEPDLQPVLSRVPDAGGEVLAEKAEVAPGLGYWALMRDCEGNRVALHSMQ
jgi:predicted enzyme related to lactoylglutathione lyase